MLAERGQLGGPTPTARIHPRRLRVRAEPGPATPLEHDPQDFPRREEDDVVPQALGRFASGRAERLRHGRRERRLQRVDVRRLVEQQVDGVGITMLRFALEIVTRPPTEYAPTSFACTITSTGMRPAGHMPP